MTQLAVHHLHLNAQSAKAAAEWYAEHLQLTAVEVNPAADDADHPTASESELWAAIFAGSEERLPATLLWSQADSVDGSSGSTLDHFGWSVLDVDAETDRLVAAGCTLVGEPVTIGPSPTGETLRISFLIDPFGTKLELVADPDLLGFHHVHLLTPNVDADYQQWLGALGGDALTFKGFLPGIRHPNLWVLFRSSDESLAPTRGRAIDHLAFLTDNASNALTNLQQQGITHTPPQASRGGRTVGFAELGTGASGAVTVELVEEPKPQHLSLGSASRPLA